MSPQFGDDTNDRHVDHCHILQHEDDDMMRPMQLLAPSTPDAPTIQGAASAHPEAGNLVRLRYRSELGASHSLIPSSHFWSLARFWQAVPGMRVTGHGGLQVITPPPAREEALFYNLVTSPDPGDEN
jgi:hypothetical protein